MLGRLRRSGSRQFYAVALIFALMLQSVALAVAAGRLAANAGADSNQTGFEICRHNGPASDSGEAAAPGNAPERSNAQCASCCLAATPAVAAPLPSAVFHVVTFTLVPWTFTAWRLPALTVDASVRPRGPPPAA
jgi:hypothetical protein